MMAKSGSGSGDAICHARESSVVQHKITIAHHVPLSCVEFILQQQNKTGAALLVAKLSCGYLVGVVRNHKQNCISARRCDTHLQKKTTCVFGR
jgi:hypothetical protein